MCKGSYRGRDPNQSINVGPSDGVLLSMGNRPPWVVDWIPDPQPVPRLSPRSKDRQAPDRLPSTCPTRDPVVCKDQLPLSVAPLNGKGHWAQGPYSVRETVPVP